MIIIDEVNEVIKRMQLLHWIGAPAGLCYG